MVVQAPQWSAALLLHGTARRQAHHRHNARSEEAAAHRETVVERVLGEAAWAAVQAATLVATRGGHEQQETVVPR